MLFRSPDTRILPAHHGEDPPAPGRAVVARLGDLPALIPALGWDEAAFTAWVVRNQTPKPENFETIRKINLGLARFQDLDDVRELEAGPNRCAVSR